MDIATVKARMTKFFGKDDMYRVPLGVVMEDWLVAEHDRLTSDLTSAKEEIERLTADIETDLCGTCWMERNWKGRAETAESLLASERKETERLRGALREIMSYDERAGHPCDPPGYGHVGTLAQAALQSRQGEE